MKRRNLGPKNQIQKPKTKVATSSKIDEIAILGTIVLTTILSIQIIFKATT